MKLYPSVCLSVCNFVCLLSVCLLVCLLKFLYLFVPLSVDLYVCLIRTKTRWRQEKSKSWKCIRLSVSGSMLCLCCLYVCPFVCLSAVYLMSVYLFFCLSTCQSVCLFVYRPMSVFFRLCVCLWVCLRNILKSYFLFCKLVKMLPLLKCKAFHSKWIFQTPFMLNIIY